MCDSNIWDNFRKDIINKPRKDECDKRNYRRISRAISWGKKSCKIQNDSQLDDPQMEFICLFIAIDALSGQGETVHNHNRDEKSKSISDFDNFVKKIITETGNEDKIYEVIKGCHDDIHQLFALRYVCKEFWQAIYDNVKWECTFEKDIIAYNKFSSYANNQKKLSLKDIFHKIFSRLRVVRNQIMHGSMTYSETLGETQVKLGVNILGKITPCLIQIMIESDLDWGDIPYPPAGKKADDPKGKPPKPRNNK